MPDWSKAMDVAIARLEADFDTSKLDDEELEVYSRNMALIGREVIELSKAGVRAGEAKARLDVRGFVDASLEVARHGAKAVQGVKQLYDAFPRARRRP